MLSLASRRSMILLSGSRILRKPRQNCTRRSLSENSSPKEAKSTDSTSALLEGSTDMTLGDVVRHGKGDAVIVLNVSAELVIQTALRRTHIVTFCYCLLSSHTLQ